MIARIVENENLYFTEMSKLTKKYASPDFGDFGDFIYFSPCNSSHGPRIKFSGGTKETSSTTQNAPTMAYDINGNCIPEIASWMDKKNCPNGFDNKYLQKVENFINKTKAILLLVWFGKLDEADALEYFKGNLTLVDIINCCDISEDILDVLVKSKNLEELHKKCIKFNLYNF